MELEPGLKLSDAGPIPDEWEAVALGDHLEFKNGISKPGHYFGHGSPIVNYMDVFAQPHLSLDRLQGKVSVTKDEAKRFSVRRGDVFFTRTSETAEEIGMSTVAMTDRQNVVFSGFVLRGRPMTNEFDSAYLGYALRTDGTRRQIESRATYTTRALINGGLLSLTNIVRPPLPEQRAIAEVLGDIDAWVAAAEAETAKLEQIRAAAIDALLTPTMRLPGFDEDWVQGSVGDAAVVMQGGTPSTTVSAFWGGGIPWCTPTDITSIEGNVLVKTERTISQAGLHACAAKLLPVGSVLLCTRATIGAAKIAALPVATNQGFRSLVARSNIDPTYLFYAILTLKTSFIERASGSTFLEISKADVEATPMLFPPTLEEQRAIAAVLTDIDTELATARTSVAKAKGVKAAAMDALLLGRVRLPLP